MLGKEKQYLSTKRSQNESFFPSVSIRWDTQLTYVLKLKPSAGKQVKAAGINVKTIQPKLRFCLVKCYCVTFKDKGWIMVSRPGLPLKWTDINPLLAIQFPAPGCTDCEMMMIGFLMFFLCLAVRLRESGPLRWARWTVRCRFIINNSYSRGRVDDKWTERAIIYSAGENKYIWYLDKPRLGDRHPVSGGLLCVSLRTREEREIWLCLESRSSLW